MVNSIQVGNGFHTMKYLAQYVFRVAISNNRILYHEAGYVTFKYKDSQRKLWNIMKLTTEEFMRRFLQHVLPGGFVKVRYFGLFASKNRCLLQIVKELLGCPAAKKENKKLKKDKGAVFYCPKCGKEMTLITTVPRRWQSNKSPPLENYFRTIYETEHLAVN